jgi:hypothetical protein
MRIVPTRRKLLLSAVGAMMLAGGLGTVVPAAAATRASAAPASAQASPAKAVWAPIWDHNGKCLDMTQASKKNGAAAQQWACDKKAQQNWDLKSILVNGTQLYLIVNRVSGKCLSILHNDTNPGAAVVQWTCNNKGTDPFELWYLYQYPHNNFNSIWYIVYNVGDQSGKAKCNLQFQADSAPCGMHPAGNGTKNGLHIFITQPDVSHSKTFLWRFSN